MVEIWWHLPTEHLIQMTTVKREEFIPPRIWSNYRINRIKTILYTVTTYLSSFSPVASYFRITFIGCRYVVAIAQNQPKKKLINSWKTEANAGLVMRLKLLITIILSFKSCSAVVWLDYIVVFWFRRTAGKGTVKGK